MPYLGVISFFMIMLSPLFPPLLLACVSAVQRIFHVSR
jgi:hypothetical protein